MYENQRRTTRVKHLFALTAIGAIALALGALSAHAQETLLHSFTFINEVPLPRGDGLYPSGRVIEAQDGNYYGTTSGIVDPGFQGGTFYSLTPAGSITILHQFLGESDGETPSDVIQASDGNFYGETVSGGDYGFGTIFRVDLTGRLTTLYSFPETYNSMGQVNPQGQNPRGGLVQGSDLDLYGVTGSGGTGSYGTAFKISLSGVFTALHDFKGSTDGASPSNRLLEASDGNFYGTTSSGACTDQTCDLSDGGIFALTPAGSLTFPYKASNQNGVQFNSSPLLEGPGGVLFGAANLTYIQPDNVVYSFSLAGTYSTFYTFPSDGSEGQDPGDLVLGADQNFYGYTSYGGSFSGFSCGNGCGTLFRLSPACQLTDLHNFKGFSSDGAQPEGPVLLTSQGTLVGSTSTGGANLSTPLDGAVYKFTPPQPPGQPVAMTVTPSEITIGKSAALDWKVYGAFSKTSQMCFAFVQNQAPGAGKWTGQQTGALSSNIYSGGTSVTPTAVGTYTYALTCGGTISGFATLNVTNTTTTISAAPNPVFAGQVISIKTEVSNAGAKSTPTGAVSFYIGTALVGTGVLDATGTATLTASTAGAAPGTYPLSANYGGDSTHSPSVSGPLNLQINPVAVTQVSISGLPNPVVPPATVNLTATVARLSGTGFPTGTATFYYGSFALGKVSLSGSGKAQLSVPTNGIPPGNYSLTTVYSGDVGDLGSSSAAFNLEVK